MKAAFQRTQRDLCPCPFAYTVSQTHLVSGRQQHYYGLACLHEVKERFGGDY